MSEVKSNQACEGIFTGAHYLLNGIQKGVPADGVVHIAMDLENTLKIRVDWPKVKHHIEFILDDDDRLDADAKADSYIDLIVVKLHKAYKQHLQSMGQE